MLKADFHIHTGEDIHDFWIKYSAREFIDRASELGFEVLAITNHEKVHYNKRLADYAKKRGILLIPGIEAGIERKHVVILNATKKVEEIKTFEELGKFKKKNPNIFVLAAHPFYSKRNSLGKHFFKHHELFDGIEYCHYYFKLFNRFNKKAVKAAKKYKKPIIGTSDSHQFIQFGKTYSLIDADKNINSIIKAMKKNKVRLITTHLSIVVGIRAIYPMMMRGVKKLFRNLTKSL